MAYRANSKDSNTMQICHTWQLGIDVLTRYSCTNLLHEITFTSDQTNNKVNATCVTLHGEGFRFVIIRPVYQTLHQVCCVTLWNKGDKGLATTYFPFKPNLSYPLQPSQLLLTGRYRLPNFDLPHFPHLHNTCILILNTTSSIMQTKQCKKWFGKLIEV